VSVVNQITRLVRSRSTANPKTPLGFYAAAIVGLLTGSVTISGILATSGVLLDLVPYILGVGAGLSLLIVIGVFAINYGRPQNLTLGQITGREFAAIEKVTLGDSRQGERVVVAGTTPVETPSATLREPARPAIEVAPLEASPPRRSRKGSQRENE